MSTYYAQANANWNASNQWNTAANGSGSYGTPTLGDTCYLNGKTVTLNLDVDLGSGIIRNDAGSGTINGTLQHTSSATYNLICDLYLAGSGTLISLTSTGILNHTGVKRSVSGLTGGTLFSLTGSGTVTTTGNTTQDVGVTVGFIFSLNSLACTFNHIGDITLAAANNLNGGVSNSFNNVCTLAITGTVNVGAGSGNGSLNVGANTANITITNVIGGTNSSVYAITTSGNLVINITGYLKPGTGANADCWRHTTATTLTGNINEVFASNYPNDAYSSSTGFAINNIPAATGIKCKKFNVGSGGIWPVYGRVFIWQDGTEYFKGPQSNQGSITTMGAQTVDFTTANNIRSGVTQNGGSIVGTLVVPANTSVAKDIIYDNGTVGQAILTPQLIKKSLKKLTSM